VLLHELANTVEKGRHPVGRSKIHGRGAYAIARSGP
jgi:hypothetical protein